MWGNNEAQMNGANCSDQVTPDVSEMDDPKSEPASVGLGLSADEYQLFVRFGRLPHH